MPAPNSDYLELLRALNSHGIEYILVGGVCAVLHGAPVATFDLDVVHSRNPENINRLLVVLKFLGATSRSHPGSDAHPDHSHLASPGHQLLMTKYGPLDLLGNIGTGRGYDELHPHSEKLQLEEGLTIRLLNLETLIQVKEETSREKDLAVLPLLRRTLEENKR